jgi:hypothetical protein
LVGDKGYINKCIKHRLFKNNKLIKLITPLIKNQRGHKKNKHTLKKRFKVEAVFGIIKRTYKRLQLIYDRNIKNYETFLIMALTCQFLKAIIRK